MYLAVDASLLVLTRHPPSPMHPSIIICRPPTPRGANTAIVVSSPLIGKTAATGAQRFVATFIGGLLGMALLLTEQQALLIVGSFVLSVASAVGGVHFKVDVHPSGKRTSINQI